MGRLRSSSRCSVRSRIDSESSRISPQVVYLLLGLLADQKLLLTASDPAVLVPAAQALRALMLPLAHSATCVPFLPLARLAHFCVRKGMAPASRYIPYLPPTLLAPSDMASRSISERGIFSFFHPPRRCSQGDAHLGEHRAVPHRGAREHAAAAGGGGTLAGGDRRRP